MIDTVRLSQEVVFDKWELIKKHHWKYFGNPNPNSPYRKILSKKLKQFGLYFAYFPPIGYEPGILWIRFSSLPKFLHGSNVWYLTRNDLNRLEKKFQKVLRSIGITNGVSLDTLRIRIIDIAFNLDFKFESLARKLLKAFKEMAHWGLAFPKRIEIYGVYFRYRSSPNSKRSSAGNAGLLIYDKREGILRFEVRINRTEGVKRHLGGDLTIPEFFDKQEEVKNLFMKNLKRAYIYPESQMISYAKAERKVFKAVPKYRMFNKRAQQFWALTHLGEDAVGFSLGLRSKYAADRFRDVFMGKKLGLSMAFLGDDDDREIPLWNMVMEEIGAALDGRSKFQRVNYYDNQIRVDHSLHTPIFKSPMDVGRWVFSMFAELRRYVLQLSCNRAFWSLSISKDRTGAVW